MLHGGVRFESAENAISPTRYRSASAMAELFAPLPHLLSAGGDPRLTVNPASGVNEYGCSPYPCPQTLSFSSSTATSISQRGYERAHAAREALMRSAIASGIEAAFDCRIEAMRDELRGYLGLPPAKADVVFAPSGTDAQLLALFLVGARLGAALTTVIVGADQTGSGTVNTARGCHFSAATANGGRVRKGEPIAGLAQAVESIAVPLLDDTGEPRSQNACDGAVFAAVEKAAASGGKVLLQAMDSSKFGWRAPSDRCLDEIVERWPEQVQVVIDACQMRLGRARLRNYLERGYMVIITGSKFFTGPPFSGALLLPSPFACDLDRTGTLPCGLFEYASRSDWPRNWPNLRSQFPVRNNLGQWLRWEAALEEIGAYYRVPHQFRVRALTTFGRGVERLIGASPSLLLMRSPHRADDGRGDDEELGLPTMFPFKVRRGDRVLALDECKALYRALAGEADDPAAGATPCLIGQPVALGHGERPQAAALRISAGARLVSETFSPEENVARDNLQRALDGVGTVVTRLERLLAGKQPQIAEAHHGH
jgi:hypothetical protein